MIGALRYILKTKKTLMLLSIVVLFSSVLAIVSIPFTPVAKADSITDFQQQCFDTFDISKVENITQKTFEASTCYTSGTCVYLKKTDIDTDVSCIDPKDTANQQTLKDAANAEVAPLVELVCGAEPADAGTMQYQWLPCSENVTNIYQDCSYPNEGPFANQQNPSSTTAQCAVPLLNKLNRNKVTAASTTTAITNGRKNAANITQAAADGQAKAACQKAGGTYTDGKCNNATSTTVCAGGALGWLLCPLAKLFNEATALVADQLQDLLTFKPLLVGNNGAPLKAIWSVILNISNVLLVIVFMVVVFSQATSVGLSAYGIKKLLPKLVAAAILVNLSFYICAFGIDVSNILGESVKGIIGAGFDAISGAGGLQNTSGPSWLAAYWDAQIAGMAALIAYASGTLPLILPVVAAGVVAFVTAWFVIGMRVVVLTLLVVVSPLAFVAWVLPNTAPMFTRWRKLFTGLLLMYPVVMAIFYGAALVSAIILAT